MIENDVGGANTNRNGLSFEERTDLAQHLKKDFNGRYQLAEYPIESKNMVKRGAKDHRFLVHDRITDENIGVVTKQFQFYNVLKQVYGIENIHHKFWKPDEAFFNFKHRTVFIVEKKYQNGSGSVDEKLFGFNAKRVLYQEIFNRQMKEPVIPVEFVAMFNRSWWLDGQTLDEAGKIKKQQSVDYHDYFDSLRNNGVRIMFDHYEDWFLGLNG
ncbi:hypothetical protein [Limosilactobacillus fastidiosus]|uniref:Restriction endonuclease n=1 Tax=Limosilactobacillus fastidiosus TaxID=2759855 RepID=A0ABR6E884_9LACO|nr:hypothetical protein [Limosilactobacillus fastidiosus]MBB1063401.1 hypothetical protein [Limosilactobacillus fastidiosus]MCD7084669.1 hypothetical protein [Limosilactobacillus fastidiosus]